MSDFFKIMKFSMNIVCKKYEKIKDVCTSLCGKRILWRKKMKRTGFFYMWFFSFVSCSIIFVVFGHTWGEAAESVLSPHAHSVTANRSGRVGPYGGTRRQKRRKSHEIPAGATRFASANRRELLVNLDGEEAEADDDAHKTGTGGQHQSSKFHSILLDL